MHIRRSELMTGFTEDQTQNDLPPRTNKFSSFNLKTKSWVLVTNGNCYTYNIHVGAPPA